MTYLTGLLTLPAIAVLVFVGIALLHAPRWDEMQCNHCEARWAQAEHPHRPWWVWRMKISAHDLVAGHRQAIKEWQSIHTSKPHWWNRRRVTQ